jgi:hypothetical protein
MDEWLTVEEAADRLQVSIRQANRYGHGDSPRLRTKRAGKRVLYHRGDVEQLADDLGVVYKPRPPELAVDLVPAGEMLNYLRERDQRIDQLTHELMMATRRIVELEHERDRRLLPEDGERLRQQLTLLEAERDALQVQFRRPWWKRLLGRD